MVEVYAQPWLIRQNKSHVFLIRYGNENYTTNQVMQVSILINGSFM